MGWFVSLIAVALVGYSGWEAARCLFRQPSGRMRWLAAAVVSWSYFTISLQFLGAIGQLNRPAILTFCAMGAGLAWLLRWPDVSNEQQQKPDPGWNLASMTALTLALAPCFYQGTFSLLGPPKIVSDGPIYHLFFAAKWWKAGRIFLVASPFGENAATYFPANGDLFFAGLMTLFGGDRLARIGQVPFLLMAGLAAYVIARRLGASASSSLIAVCLFVTSMPLLLFSFEANVDTIFVAGYLAVVAFGLQYMLDGRDPRSLILAGLAAGCAWGTKPTATVFLPPLMSTLGFVILYGSRSKREKIRHLVLLGMTTLVPCGFWFARSLGHTGNPLYPVHLELFGRVILHGWYRSEAMSRSQFYLPVDDWRVFGSIGFMVFDFRLMPLFLAALLGFWSWRRPRPFGGVVWGISLLALLNIAIYWFAIPYRTQQRFMLQSVGLLAAPLALLLDRGRTWRWAAVILLAIHVLTPQDWPWSIWRPGVKAPWELSPKVPTVAGALFKIPRSPAELALYWNSPGGVEFLATLGVTLLASGFTAAMCGLASRRTGAAWKALGFGSGVIGFAAVVAVGMATSPGLSGRIFPLFRDYQRGWNTLERVSPPGGTRVAYAGTNLPYYLMAGGLRNEVIYVNIDRHRDWQMHDYHRTAALRGDPTLWDTPRPGWDRIHPDYDSWLANLRTSKIRLLVVARANWVDGKFNLADAESFPIERVWADLHPEIFERVHPATEPDPLMRIYRIREK